MRNRQIPGSGVKLEPTLCPRNSSASVRETTLLPARCQHRQDCFQCGKGMSSQPKSQPFQTCGEGWWPLFAKLLEQRRVQTAVWRQTRFLAEGATLRGCVPLTSS